jgi:hypothetical protein
MYYSKISWLLAAVMCSQVHGTMLQPILEDERGDGYSVLKISHRDVTTCTGVDIMNSNRPLEIIINTGSLLGFCDKGVVGRFIQDYSGDTREGLSHVGMAIVAYPSEIWQIIRESSIHGGLARRPYAYTLAQQEVMTTAYPYLVNAHGDPNAWFRDLDEPLSTFCLESVGTAGQVMQGLLPRVQITPLAQVVDAYEGDVCVRTLHTPLTLASLQERIINELGVSYETNPMELFKSCSDGNKDDDTSSWFCSELVAFIYRERGIIPQNVRANNVIPKEFSLASRIDYLRNYATPEQWLKIYKEPGFFKRCCGCCGGA